MKNGIQLVETIDLLLQEKNQTRKDFCKSINIPPSTIATWKTRNICPTVDVLSVIANNLGISLDWLVNDSSAFDELEETLGNYSRKSIRLRIYQSLKNKYVKVDDRFTDDFLENENRIKELHNYYFSGGYVSYDKLLNWSKGRTDINIYIFNEWAISLNSTLQFILTGNEILIPSSTNDYSRTFEKRLYDLALEFRNELYSLDCLTEERKKSAITIINQLMELEHLKYVEKNRKDQ
jgi:transcriptional regulator with XRE-family HTH domain